MVALSPVSHRAPLSPDRFDEFGVERCDGCRSLMLQNEAVPVVSHGVPALLCPHCAGLVAKAAPAPDFGCTRLSGRAAR